MMAGLHIRREHLLLIASSHVRNSLRSGAGVIFLVLAMLLGLVMASVAVMPFELLAQSKSETAAFNEVLHRFGPDVLRVIAGTSDEQSHFLLFDRPAMVSLFFVLLIWFLPFLTALGGFNQTSGDIGSRGLRYLLLRTERANVFLGRLLGAYVFVLTVISIVIALVAIYVSIKVGVYPALDVLTWCARGWLACAALALPWMALCAWISAAIPLPFVALITVQGGLAFWTILVAILRGKLAELGYLAYVTPWGFKYWLIDASIGKMLLAVVVMLGFTAVFTLLGLRTFHRRDV
jgi:hypothetical protein